MEDGPGCQVDRGLTDRQCWLLAAFLIVGSTVLRLIYLGYHCPLDLAPDEAHYWDWSRHPDWSYYSKGPGIAWLIRLSCELFGSLSIWMTGNEMWAVRLPAVICSALLLTSMYILTIQVSGRHRVGLLVVAVALTTPTISAGASLMTIDAPYTCCWGWALVFAHRAVFRRNNWAWWATGLVICLGVLFKYNMVVWVPSLACFLLFSREHRALLWSKGFWILCGIGSLSGIPILLWNWQNEWVSFHHVSSLAGMRDQEPQLHWLGPVKFLGVQCALWLVFWFVVWVRAMLASAPWKSTTPDYRYLWWMSAPIFGIFLAFSLKTDGGQPNWPVTAYVSGMVLGLLWMVDELSTAAGWYRRIAFGSMWSSVAAGILLVAVVHFSAWAHPLLEPLAGPATAAQPIPLRRLDPTLRLQGWHELAEEVDQLRRSLRERKEEPILASAAGWNMPGLLAFYCEDHPTVYTLGPVYGERRSQYDFWRPNPLRDPAEFFGRTFLIVTTTDLDLTGVFESVESHRVVCRSAGGQPLSKWVLLVCRGYRGFRPLSENRIY